MKWILVLVAAALFSVEAHASRAQAFEGWYEILSRRDLAAAPASKPYFLLDADPLGVIWDRYANSPLPENLEKYRHEPAILAGFTDRDLLFLALEQGATIGNNFISFEGGEGDKLELRRRPDGGADLAVSDNGRVSIYSLAPARETPESR